MAGISSVVSILFRSAGAHKVKRDVRGINSSLSHARKTATRLAALGAGMAAGYVFARMAKETIEFDKKLTQLSIQGHIAADSQVELRQQIHDVAQSTGVARDQVLAFTQGIVDATGNMQLGRDAMKAVAMAAQVTGADMQGLGTLVSDAFLKFGISGKDAESTLSILIEQGEKGRYTLNEMAQTGARAMSVAGLAGMKGVEGMREMGATMQLIRQGFGSAQEAATGFKVMVAKIYSSESQRKLKKLGVALRDPETGKLRKFGDVFLDILRASKGDAMMLSDLFGTKGIMGVQEFRNIMDKNGGSVEAVTAELEKYRNVSGTAANLQRKFGRASDTTAVQIEKVKEQFKALIDENLLTPATLNSLAEALDNLSISASFLAETTAWWKEKMGFGKDEGVTASQQRAKQYERIGAVAGLVMGGPMGAAIGYGIGKWLGKRHVEGVSRAGWTTEDEMRAQWAGLAQIGKGPVTQSVVGKGGPTAFEQAIETAAAGGGPQSVLSPGAMEISDASLTRQAQAFADALSGVSITVDPGGGGGKLKPSPGAEI